MNTFFCFFGLILGKYIKILNDWNLFLWSYNFQRIWNLSDIQNALILSKFRKNYKIFILLNGEENV